MKDYRVEIKVRNAPLLRAMERAGFYTAMSCAKAAGIQPSELGRYLNLLETPIIYGNKPGLPCNEEGWRWRRSVIKLSKALRDLPENLFPPQHIRKAIRSNRASVEMSLDEFARLPTSIVPLIENHQTPEGDLIDRDLKVALKQALEELNPVEELVVRMRYGLDTDARTLDEVATEIDRSRERVRQIELKALRKLRKPDRMHCLIEAGGITAPNEGLPNRHVKPLL